MNMLSLLIFDLDGTRFGLNATAVLETVRLPELTPIEEAPPWVVGMFSLRGPIVPVIDLHLRFGHSARPYALSDQVIVLKTEHRRIGLVVSEVLDVVEIRPESVQASPEFDTKHHGLKHLSIGMACIADDLVTLLDIPQLEKLPQTSEPEETPEPAELCQHLYAETSPEALSLLHARAVALRKPIVEDEANRLGLAVVEISGEYFGIELTAVQEFCNVSQVTPIPCCPPHVLGTISLRGNLLTLLDPRNMLNLASSIETSKAVIAYHQEQLIGIAVDEVHDVVYLYNEDLQAAPSALDERFGAEIVGTGPFDGKTMTVLDLPALLKREEWIVNETV